MATVTTQAPFRCAKGDGLCKRAASTATDWHPLKPNKLHSGEQLKKLRLADEWELVPRSLANDRRFLVVPRNWHGHPGECQRLS